MRFVNYLTILQQRLMKNNVYSRGLMTDYSREEELVMEVVFRKVYKDEVCSIDYER